MRLTKNEADEDRKKREKFQRNKSGKGKGKAAETGKKTDDKIPFLLHTHNGKTYDLGKPLDEQESDEECAPSEAGDDGDAAPEESGLTADNVVAGAKRKNVASPEAASKKAKPSADSPKSGTTLALAAPVSTVADPAVKKNPFANLKRKAT